MWYKQSSACEKIDTESGSEFGPVLIFILFVNWFRSFGECSEHYILLGLILIVAVSLLTQTVPFNSSRRSWQIDYFVL